MFIFSLQFPTKFTIDERFNKLKEQQTKISEKQLYRFVGTNQKVLVEGSHPNRSKFVRVVVTSKVSNKNIQATELPVGFRGPNHLVTSGTMLSQVTDLNIFHASDVHQRVVEPPIPYRENLTIGTGLNKKVDARLYWGLQTSRKIDPSDPNKLASFDKSILSFAKFFPTFFR